MMYESIRQRIEKQEHIILCKSATFSDESIGRDVSEKPCNIRTCFQRDRDRIIHCEAFRRLKQKTQVFLSPDDDHYRTRLTHTLEVSQIARTMARALELNEDLTEAIALGHDLGHTPFGHAGERALNSLNPNGFKHYLQSVRVVEKLEKQGMGLNLCAEVRDGIGTHSSKSSFAKTKEGILVRYADKIAYMNHDIEDAISAGVLSANDIPKQVVQTLGDTKSARITSLIEDIVHNSAGKPIQMSQEISEAYNLLHKFMYSTVYVDKVAKREEKKVDALITMLYEYFINKPENMPIFYRNIIDESGKDRAVTDYISGMSDAYAVKVFDALYIPKNWRVTLPEDE